MRYFIPLLLLIGLLAACSKHAPAPNTNAAVATTAKKNTANKNNVVVADNDSSSSASSSDSSDEPVQLSETETPDTDSASTSSQSLALRSLQPPPVVASAWKEGVHYKRLSPVQPTTAMPGQIEVTEAFWYGSAHCYVLDQSLDVWRKQKAKYLSYVRLPVMWGGIQRLHARMFYIAELLGKSDELHSAMFQELQVRKAPLESIEQIQAFFVAHGVSAEDFKRANASPAIDASLKHAQIMGDRYRIASVPLLIINGRYVTDVAMAGGQAQLLVLVNELAAREHGD